MSPKRQQLISRSEQLFIRRLVCPHCANTFEVRQDQPFSIAQRNASHEVPCPKCSSSEGPHITRMRIAPEHNDTRGVLPVERDVAILRVTENRCIPCGESAAGYELVEEEFEMDSACSCSPGGVTPHRLKLRRRA